MTADKVPKLSEQMSEYMAAVGKKGGLARAKKLSKKRLKEIAAMGGAATKGAKRKAKTKKYG